MGQFLWQNNWWDENKEYKVILNFMFRISASYLVGKIHKHKVVAMHCKHTRPIKTFVPSSSLYTNICIFILAIIVAFHVNNVNHFNGKQAHLPKSNKKFIWKVMHFKNSHVQVRLICMLPLYSFLHSSHQGEYKLIF